MSATPISLFAPHARCNGVANPLDPTLLIAVDDMIPTDCNAATYVATAPNLQFQQLAPTYRRTPPNAVDCSAIYTRHDSVDTEKSSNAATTTPRSRPASPTKSPVSHAEKVAFVVAYLRSKPWSKTRIDAWLVKVTDEAVRSQYRRLMRKEDGSSPTPRHATVDADAEPIDLDEDGDRTSDRMRLRSVSIGSTTSTSSTDSWQSRTSDSRISGDSDGALALDVDLADLLPLMDTMDDNDQGSGSFNIADDVPDIESFDAEAMAEQLAICVAASERRLSLESCWW